MKEDDGSLCLHRLSSALEVKVDASRTKGHPVHQAVVVQGYKRVNRCIHHVARVGMQTPQVNPIARASEVGASVVVLDEHFDHSTSSVALIGPVLLELTGFRLIADCVPHSPKLGRVEIDLCLQHDFDASVAIDVGYDLVATEDFGLNNCQLIKNRERFHQLGHPTDQHVESPSWIEDDCVVVELPVPEIMACVVQEMSQERLVLRYERLDQAVLDVLGMHELEVVSGHDVRDLLVPLVVIPAVFIVGLLGSIVVALVDVDQVALVATLHNHGAKFQSHLLLQCLSGLDISSLLACRSIVVRCLGLTEGFCEVKGMKSKRLTVVPTVSKVVDHKRSHDRKASETHETNEVFVYSQVLVQHPASVSTFELVIFFSSELRVAHETLGTLVNLAA